MNKNSIFKKAKKISYNNQKKLATIQKGIMITKN